MDFAKEKGASTWLTAIPLVEHGFALHKGAFQDALALRYGWTPADMPLKCECGKTYQWNMPCPVLGEDSPQSGTTRSGT